LLKFPISDLHVRQLEQKLFQAVDIISKLKSLPQSIILKLHSSQVKFIYCNI